MSNIINATGKSAWYYTDGRMVAELKEVEVTGIRFTGDNKQEIVDFGVGVVEDGSWFKDELTISTPSGKMKVKISDIIVKSFPDGFYPVTADVFEKNFKVK